MRPPRILSFTTLYPNAALPMHAPFVRARVEAQARLTELQVMAPVPWAPPLPGLPARFYRSRTVLEEEAQGSVRVLHPRFTTIPGVLKTADPILLALACMKHVRRLHAVFPFDIIDAHWACPDGVAATMLAWMAGVPVSITVRGDDLNVFGQEPGRRQQIAWSLRRAAGVIALSSELAERAISLGARPDCVAVVPNGVDASVFHLMDRQAARERLGIDPQVRLLLSAGRLHRSKGFHTLVRAVGRLGTDGGEVVLAIAGAADYEADATPAIHEEARRAGIGHRVRLLGPLPPGELVTWYNAADLFCLATEREGSANVLIEAQACGLPCVTTDVGGNRDAVPDDRWGVLTLADVESMADGIRRALARTFDRNALAARASARGWDAVAGECLTRLQRAASTR